MSSAFKARRQALLESMPENSIAVLYAGRETLGNEDEYLPFAVNSNFYYLTDYSRAGMILLLAKYAGRKTETLFIEEADDFTERWTGKMPRKAEVEEKAQIDTVSYVTDFNSAISRILGGYEIESAYFDIYRYHAEDLPTYNAAKAAEFAALYPAVQIKDLRSLILPLRECKDEEEIARMKKAADITRVGLEEVLKRLQPGMKEYQAQAVFEGSCMYCGADGLAFPTIAAGGKNACSMHYDTNRDELADGSLLLLDLGASYENYCSDVTRTYPVNGKYTARQRQVYELVLAANKAVVEKAAPGVTLGDLETLTCDILGEGLVKLGLIEDKSQVRQYYMHSVSHSLGIDSHDASRRGEVLKPGWVISDEPGLYIDEEGIGIRIEDDLLITEEGCEVLTAAIPKDPDEIEKLMAAR